MAYDNKNNKASYNKNNKFKLSFPERYLEGGYFEYKEDKEKKKKILKSEYIIEYPKHIVKIFIENRKNREQNKTTQLRKYYDFAVRIKDTLKYNIKTFDEVYPEIRRLEYSSTYAQTRGKVSGDFVTFIKDNLKNIKSKDDFFAFVTHFEAIIAYLPKD